MGLLIVDEAHACAGDSGRRSAVETLAAGAAYVLLLSATPHNGHNEAFTALCRIGEVGAGAPLLVFRRTRTDVGIGTKPARPRRRVRPGRDESRMHAALARYGDAIRGEHRAGSRAGLVGAA